MTIRSRTPDKRRSRKKPEPVERLPGRPRAGSDDHSQALLDAAVAIYTRDGIAHARLRDIAASAGVTPALIGYYFGGKQALVQAVIEQRILPAVAMMETHLAQASDDPRALIEGFVRGVHATVARHPWLPALWVREILSEGGALRELLLDRIAPRLPKLLAERFIQARKQRRLNGDLDPRLLVVSLVGLTFFPLAAEPIWRRLFPDSDIDASALMQHTFALLERGLDADHAR